jgi:predicted Rossmann fold flavoprotein
MAERPPQLRVAVIGGGAAGFFCAVNAARLLGSSGEVHLLEQSPHFLRKVKISGGGRCNVTHACFDPAKLSRHYPRGERELRGPFRRFQPRDTIAWFAERGVTLKTEADGRMFPVTDSSQTIIDCLLREARRHGVRLRPQTPVRRVEKTGDTFRLHLGTEKNPLPPESFDRLVIASGGGKELAFLQELELPVIAPVPSLFSFHLPGSHWLRALPGLTLPAVRLQLPGTRLETDGPLLVTHEGISGPAVLKLSARAARELAEKNYRFTVQARWQADLGEHEARAWIERQRRTAPARKPANTPPPGLPARFWEALLSQPGGPFDEVRWTTLPRAQAHWIVDALTRSSLPVEGKSLNKEEFVTCGGIALSAVHFHTMESRTHPGLHFAGEVLDLDGVTGGFNFQAAWTTAWIAAQSLAGTPHRTGRSA